MKSKKQQFAEAHVVGFCKVPKNLKRLAAFKALKRQSVPLSCVCLGTATKTEDQGSTPQCAAYSASSMVENILWKRNGYVIDDIDPKKLYRYAKSVDGDPNGDGTTLTAILEAVLQEGWFDTKKSQVRVITNAFDLKAAIHKYGTCIAGFNITDEWYEGKPVISGRSGAASVGGHAVQVVGYDQDYCYIQNSWGREWGHLGFAKLTWEAFERQFLYAACLTNCLDGLG